MNTVSEFHDEVPRATASEGLAQGPYVAARAVRTHDLSDESQRIYQWVTMPHNGCLGINVQLGCNILRPQF